MQCLFLAVGFFSAEPACDSGNFPVLQEIVIGFLLEPEIEFRQITFSEDFMLV